MTAGPPCTRLGEWFCPRAPVLQRLAYLRSMCPSTPYSAVRAAVAAWMLLAHGHSVQFSPAFMTKAHVKNKDVAGTRPAATAADSAAPETKRPAQSFREGDVSVSIWARE